MEVTFLIAIHPEVIGPEDVAENRVEVRDIGFEGVMKQPEP